MRFRIFCDFDGTLAVHDVGNLLFTQFADSRQWWHLVALWRKGEIDGRAMWQRICEVTRIRPDQLDQFAASQAIDPGFVHFRQFCQDLNFPLYVVSDGMDAYIHRILLHHGLHDLQVRSNHLDIGEDGTLHVTFPYYGHSCGTCANCKGAHIRLERQIGEQTVYVGDGLSDKCAAGEADILFAKKDLERYCMNRGFRYESFNTFFDVLENLNERVQGKRG
jgi:2,3-diketo-5-methylthio-1-phosphopentane phosphatase